MIAPFTKSAVLEILRTPAASDTFPDMIRRVEALEGCGVRVKALEDFVADFASAKIDALRYQPAYGESPEDEPDPVVEAETVWAWQADAKTALAALEPVAQPEPGPSSPYAGLSGIWSSSIYADHSAPDLTDQTAVHLNMLRGTIAKPTVDQIIHIYGVDVLCKALAPRIVREAVSGGNPMWCDGCRSTGAVHCAHPDECGNMLSATGAADQWKSWLDDLPLPFTFDSAIGRLQDFITALTTLVDVPQPHPPREPGAEPTPAQFELMCLAIEDVVTGRGFDVDPWRSIQDNPPPDDGEPHIRGLWVTSNRTGAKWWEAVAGHVDDDGDFVDHDGNAPWRCEDYGYWMPLPKPPGETTSAIPEEVKAYLREVLMVGGWRGERD